MKSGKQRRAEMKAERAGKAAKALLQRPPRTQRAHPPGTAPCNVELLAPHNSYGAPEFVRLGYYTDRPFSCVDCGKQEVWRATQQKWWYEVAKGFAYSTANRCNACRRRERERQARAREVHLEGVVKKAGAKA